VQTGRQAACVPDIGKTGPSALKERGEDVDTAFVRNGKRSWSALVKPPFDRGVVALDVGSSGVRAAQFTNPRRPKLERYAALPLPAGTVNAGVVMDPAALAKVLKELWVVGKFTSKQVIFSVANDRVLVRQLDLDWMEPADFRKALPYSVADALPMSMDDANLDYHVIEEFPADEEQGLERTLRVLVVSATRDMIETFVTAMDEAGLSAKQAELAAFALIRAAAASAEPVPTDTAEAIVDIGADTLTVVTHTGGRPRFVRTVGHLGGRFITGELQQKFGWSFDEAEQAKTTYGLPRPRQADSGEGGSAAVDHPAQRAIADRVDSVVAEVRTTLNFFLSAGTGVTRLSRIVLTGGGALLGGLDERISAALGVPVVGLTPPDSVKLTGIAPDATVEAGSIALLAGLALGVE
jgi:type IV pilus assembly protein PilM